MKSNRSHYEPTNTHMLLLLDRDILFTGALSQSLITNLVDRSTSINAMGYGVDNKMDILFRFKVTSKMLDEYLLPSIL